LDFMDEARRYMIGWSETKPKPLTHGCHNWQFGGSLADRDCRLWELTA